MLLIKLLEQNLDIGATNFAWIPSFVLAPVFVYTFAAMTKFLLKITKY
jgi:hypothetical protein